MIRLLPSRVLIFLYCYAVMITECDICAMCFMYVPEIYFHIQRDFHTCCRLIREKICQTLIFHAWNDSDLSSQRLLASYLSLSYSPFLEVCDNLFVSIFLLTITFL